MVPSGSIMCLATSAFMLLLSLLFLRPSDYSEGTTGTQYAWVVDLGPFQRSPKGKREFLLQKLNHSI